MKNPMTRSENQLLWIALALLTVAIFGPAMAQPAHHHDFADQRLLWGIPFAMDVLSNLPFAVAGLTGLVSLCSLPAGRMTNMARAMSALFFGGLLLAAGGSTWYHLQPDDAGLVVDRCAMAVAFAGLSGLAAASKVGERAAGVLGLGVLTLAAMSVYVWAETGNVLPWAVVQFGGMAMVLWLACLRPRADALDVRWLWVIAAYTVAKVLELNDHTIFDWTGDAISGHTLKHAVAALAAWPVLCAVRRRHQAARHNPLGADQTKANTTTWTGQA